MLMDLMLVYDKFYRPLPGIVGTIQTHCMLGNFACVLSSTDFPSKFTFSKSISCLPSEGQTV